MTRNKSDDDEWSGMMCDGQWKESAKEMNSLSPIDLQQEVCRVVETFSYHRFPFRVL